MGIELPAWQSAAVVQISKPVPVSSGVPLCTTSWPHARSKLPFESNFWMRLLL